MNIFIILVLIGTYLCNAQDTLENKKIRKDKIQTILKIQDSRSIVDGKLIKFLSDPDSIVRERATLAYGSIQDTSVLHLLVRNLDDPSRNVRMAAAFSIGQTALMLSDAGKKKIEDELIWKKLGNTDVDERLIEEIGKFGTDEALNQLIIRYANRFPRIFIKSLSMSIARFAIRGIYNPDALDYITSFFKPNSDVQWYQAYALLRISAISSSHNKILQVLHDIVAFHRHRDPNVRMNLATVFGRLKNELYCLDPLIRLAEFDSDWRVRVNAIRALSNFDLDKNDKIVSVFKRALSDENMHIALTAISELGKTNLSVENPNPMVKNLFEILWRMLENPNRTYLWQYQANSALTLSKLTKEKALPIIYKNLNTDAKLKSAFMKALANTESRQVIDTLLFYSEDENPTVALNALEALRQLYYVYKDEKETIKKVYDVLIRSLEKPHQEVIATAAVILRDSNFLDKNTTQYLIKKINKLRVPYDTDAILEIVKTIGVLKDESAIKPLISLFSIPERTIALAAVDALWKITGKDYSKELNLHLQPIYVDYDFKYLDSIAKNPIVRIETIKGDIKIELFPEVAPFTVLSFVKLAERGFYRSTYFHRIVPNFVVQGGDPEGTGWGGPGYTIRSEFSAITYDVGYVGMASSGKDTEGSQFFITQSPQPHLDGKYTLFGKVISGIDVVNKLQVDDKVFDIKLDR